MRKGIDFSWARPGGAAIRAAGKSFVMRYAPYPGDGGKGLTLDEIADYRANGLAIGLFFESTAQRHLEGFVAGRADAAKCAVADGLLGMPGNIPFYFAVDFDAQPSQYDAIDDYQRGASSVLGLARVGIYGHDRLLTHCKNAGTASWFCQTYAWSGGRRFLGAHIYQYLNGQTINGGEVDFCEALDSNAGLWEPEGNETLTKDDIVALFGSTERDAQGNLLSVEQRYANAKDRYDNALATGNSLLEQVGNALSKSGGNGKVAPHGHKATTTTVSVGEVVQ